MMKRIVIALALCGAFAATAIAVNYVTFEQVTVGATAIGFTASKITPSGTTIQATTAVCRVRTAEISYAYDGTTPTSTVGTLLEVGDTITVSGHDLMDMFRAIRTTGTSGQLDCTYTNP